MPFLIFSVLAFSWGKSTEDAFFIPDLRGRFLRGVDGDAKRDPDSQSRIASNRGGNTGNTVGTVQDFATSLPKEPFLTSASGEHKHKDPTWNGQGGPFELATLNRGPGGYDYGAEAAPTTSAGQHNHDIVGGDRETRPINAYVYWIIKAK